MTCDGEVYCNGIEAILDVSIKYRDQKMNAEEDACKLTSKIMKLPNYENAIVEQAKVMEYLLNVKHPYGGGKAHFFSKFGFCVEHWEQLAEALSEHGRRYEVTAERETGFGPRYTVDGELKTPDGRHPDVRTVWQMDEGAIAPRLITAYPLETKL